MNQKENVASALGSILLGILLIVMKGKIITAAITLLAVFVIVGAIMDFVAGLVNYGIVKSVAGICILVFGWAAAGLEHLPELLLDFVRQRGDLHFAALVHLLGVRSPHPLHLEAGIELVGEAAQAEVLGDIVQGIAFLQDYKRGIGLTVRLPDLVFHLLHGVLGSEDGEEQRLRLRHTEYQLKGCTLADIVIRLFLLDGLAVRAHNFLTGIIGSSHVLGFIGIDQLRSEDNINAVVAVGDVQFQFLGLAGVLGGRLRYRNTGISAVELGKGTFAAAIPEGEVRVGGGSFRGSTLNDTGTVFHEGVCVQ